LSASSWPDLTGPIFHTSILPVLAYFAWCRRWRGGLTMTEHLTDYEFAELERELQRTMEYLERLQKSYRKQTGKRYVGVGSGLKAKQCSEYGNGYHGTRYPFCKVKEATNG
jgi:hypothetical protein